MPRSRLPAFSSPTTRQLRELYRRSPQEVRQLVLEIVRLRELFDEIEDYRAVVQRCWREEVSGQLVALEKLRVLMMGEKSRRGELSAAPTRPAPPGADQKYPQGRDAR